MIDLNNKGTQQTKNISQTRDIHVQIFLFGTESLIFHNIMTTISTLNKNKLISLRKMESSSKFKWMIFWQSI